MYVCTCMHLYMYIYLYVYTHVCMVAPWRVGLKLPSSVYAAELSSEHNHNYTNIHTQ